VLGFAETAVHDPTCIAPQVLGFEAFVWDPDKNNIRVLPPLSGDTVTAAFHVNEQGDVVGASGICGGGLVPTSALHAVVWKNGVPSDLGNLGGSYGNLANFINDHGQVVGQSDLSGDTVFHGFLWTEDQGLQDLGALPGDVLSTANSINDQGRIAMQSCDANFNCRAAIWDHGVMTDLNTLIAADSRLFLLFASSINARGQIVGAAFEQGTESIVPFFAIPCDKEPNGNQGCQDLVQGAASGASQIELPEKIREQLRKALGLGHFRKGNAQSSSVDLLHEN
jgi:probable HAF family extracellular repeat protein